MGLVEQAHRERQPRWVGGLLAGEGQRVEVVADLLDVRVRRRRITPILRLGLVVEEVHERRLRPLDLGREHRLLAHERVDEPVERGDHLTGQLEAYERLLRGAHPLGQLTLDEDGRAGRRQRVGHEGPDLRATRRGALVSSRLSIRQR